MRKFIFVLSVLLAFSVSQVRAEQSPQTATGTRYQDNQVFTIAYNNGGASISADSVVILDTSATSGTTLGGYITTTTTADDYRVFGITDEAIAASTSGRVCIRGPHQVWLEAPYNSAAGVIVAAGNDTAGVAQLYATSDGTVGGYLGRSLASRASNKVWVWVEPQIHK